VSVALRHSLRALIREIDQPAAVLKRANELLLEGTSLNDFATAILVRMRVQGEKRFISVAAAGHPAAVHLSNDGPRLLGGGSVLGAFPDVSLSRHEAMLAGEDTLLLYTDGWLEVGPQCAHLYPQALAHMAHSLAPLDPSDLIERLRRDALRRAGGSLSDDLILLAVRPKGDSS
jgi:serine phosphatase RsbU (regulator of sigma subunit)